MARKRTQAQIDAEAAYAAEREIVQVNVKWKAAADVEMWKELRERFRGLTDSGIARMAIKELAATGNGAVTVNKSPRNLPRKPAGS
jgi:hypothetical protein